MSRYVVRGLLALMALLVLAVVGLAVPLDVAIALLLGWAFYLGRVGPQVTVDWGGVVTGVLSLVLFGAGSHAFLAWLHGQVRAADGSSEPSGRRWTPRWTASIVAVIILMFVAGISATGVAHQVGWLLTSDEPPVQSSMRWVVRRAQSSNNLKQIGLALHNYHDDHATFPPGGTFDAQGQPLHGWPAMLLPYVERLDLHDRIDFGLPWDHPRNRRAFQTDVPVYRNPGIPEQADAEGYALGHYAGNARLLGGDVSWTSGEVTDGSSTTLMAGEVAVGFEPWGDPTNWRDPALGINRSPEGFGSPFPGGANFLLGDGSVRFIKETVDPQVLRSLSTPAGGETVPADHY